MKTSLLPAVLCLFVFTAFAQDDKETISQEDNTVKAVGFSSEFLISSDFKGLYFNMMGGQIRYTNGNFAASIAIMPTLRFHRDEHPGSDGEVRPFVTPGISVGFLFTHKRIMLGFPVSYSYDSRWHPTVGLGYKFGKL